VDKFSQGEFSREGDPDFRHGDHLESGCSARRRASFCEPTHWEGTLRCSR
jgi:hypothetical protein